MKVFSRDFTLKEKILLLFLCLLLVGLMYYQFVDQPVRRAITNARTEKEEMETELVAVQAKVARLEKMKKELEEVSSRSDVSIMGSYNSSKAEMKMLNDILERADQYAITFTDVTREGDQIRRNFTLQFTAANYAAATQILTELAHGEYRCLMGDVHCTAERQNIMDGQVAVSATATFYETMVGGKPDAGLPADSSAASQESAEE